MILESSYSCGAEIINKTQQELDNKIKESNGLCEGCFSAWQRLERLKNVSSTRGWDGEDAEPVSLASYNNARRFLSEVPLGIAAPDPGVDVKGQMTLEWRQSDGRLLSLTFDELGNVHYIVFLGFERIYGMRPVSLGYSEQLKDFLENVIRE